jgi:hypothetical protein
MSVATIIKVKTCIVNHILAFMGCRVNINRKIHSIIVRIWVEENIGCISNINILLQEEKESSGVHLFS